MDGKEYQGNGIRRQGYQYDFFFFFFFVFEGTWIIRGVKRTRMTFVGVSTSALPWSKLFSST